MKNNSLFRRADIIIILILLAVTALLFTIKENTKINQAVIITDGITVDTVIFSEISQPCTKSYENGISVLIEKDGISVISSDCTGKNCINCGKLSNAGDMSVCIPNKTVIKVSGTKSNGTDAVTY